MRKLHLIWVTAHMHIEIYKYPAWSDVVEIETMCQNEGRIGTRRDWILKDAATGELIGRATVCISKLLSSLTSLLSSFSNLSLLREAQLSSIG
ncbi:hypothetical protein V6N13_106187 [Hibiscus sabdariffa]|uniref:Acyl-[acyl-carrier-protein] hydrolase n=1 Tax=Hibiscus sabdariffa TaxID=183260 RepID=A0ABR2EZX1_9ROSI